jgi:hypothetical protein
MNTTNRIGNKAVMFNTKYLVGAKKMKNKKSLVVKH